MNILQAVNKSISDTFVGNSDENIVEEKVEENIPISENIITVIASELASRQYLREGG
jgi:hypothetical protein